MHGILDRSRGILLHAAIVARHQHAPLRQRHEHRVVHLELYGQFDLARTGIKAHRLDIRFPNCRSIAVCASASNRAALKLVGSLTCSTLTLSSGGRKACGSGLHSVISFVSKPSHTEESV